MMGEAKVIVHDNVDTFLEATGGNCLGRFIFKTNEIHVMNKDLTYEVIMLHEKAHYLRKDLLTSKVMRHTWRLFIAIYIIMLLSLGVGVYFFSILHGLVMFLIIGLSLFITPYLGEREEKLIWKYTIEQLTL